MREYSQNEGEKMNNINSLSKMIKVNRSNDSINSFNQVENRNPMQNSNINKIKEND